MRRRRVERLLLRAEVAAQSGCLDDAMSALEEARKLAPGYPGITRLERELQQSPQNLPGLAARVEAGPDRRRLHRTLAAAAIVVSAIAGAVAVRAARPAQPLLTSHDARSVVPRVVAPPSKRIVPVTVMPERMDAALSAPSPQPTTPREDPGRAALTPLPVTDVMPERAPISALRSAAEPPVIDGVPAVTLAAASSREPAPVSMPAAVNEPAPERLVRHTLDDYVTAYNRLDADAAQRVWPNVDRQALARAFDDLASQRVTLGDCQIAVASETAHATCDGSTTWTPKIGGGSPRTDARTWTFELGRSAATWQIVSARVQNK
jgi:hypothetical protein